MPSATIKATADVTLLQATPDTNSNGATLSMTGATAASAKTRALLKFPFGSSVPAGVRLTSVVSGWCPSATPSSTTSYDFFALTANFDWVESGSTYNNKNATGPVAWAGGSNGCSIQPTDISSSVLGTLPVTTSSPADTAIEFTLDLTNCQAIADGTGQNSDRVLHMLGWRQGSSTSTGASFRSRNSSAGGGPDGSFTPYITVTWSDPAVSGTATSRATDSVAFPQCTYTGDSEGDETITVKRKVQGANDNTYVTLSTYYDRANKIAYAGHSVDFGGGAVVHKGDINLTPGASYTYQFTFNGGGTTKTVDQTMLSRLDPMIHSRRTTRKVAHAWFWNGSDTVPASVVDENAWIAMTKGDEASVSPASLASLTSVRGGASDVPIYQYFAVEIRRDTSDLTNNLVWRRNTIIFDATLEADFEASFSETWFLHNGGAAMANRIYNGAYNNFIVNLSLAAARSWVYKAFLTTLYDRHTDATPVATRYSGVVIDNFEQGSQIDSQWRTAAQAGPLTPAETAMDTAAEVEMNYRAMWAFFKATGTYLASNIVNGTTADQIECATLLDGVFIESTVTSFSGNPGITYRTGTDWKAHVDTLITIRDTVGGPDHLIAVIQIGTTPHGDADANFCLWSYAMFMDGVTAGCKVFFRCADNSDYDEDEPYSSGAAQYGIDWGAPSAGQYVKDTSVGSGDERVYKRVFANGVVWFNPTSGSLSPSGGPVLAARTGIWVPTVVPASGGKRKSRFSLGLGVHP